MAERFTERKEKMKEVKKVFGKTTLLFFIMQPKRTSAFQTIHPIIIIYFQ